MKWMITKGDITYGVNRAEDINVVIGADFNTVVYECLKIGQPVWVGEYRIVRLGKEKVDDIDNLWRD